MTQHRLIILVAISIVATLAYISRTTEPTTGILVTKLIYRCLIEHYTPRSQQPVHTIVLACPGVDAIRLWPWPIKQP